MRDRIGSIYELTEDDAIELEHESAAGGIPLPEPLEPEPSSPDFDVAAIPIDEEPDSEDTIVTNEEPGDEGGADHVITLLRAGNCKQIASWTERAADGPATRRRVARRIHALNEMHQGKQTDAVRSLRNACEQAGELPVIEQSRSRLAFAIGLAGARRPLEALVEGLEALARARQTGDGKAERACIAFLRKLYEEQGKDAAVWQPRIPGS